jgi:predicted metal-dependent enzyme (double-stranded beta helix superfamily)
MSNDSYCDNNPLIIHKSSIPESIQTLIEDMNQIFKEETDRKVLVEKMMQLFKNITIEKDFCKYKVFNEEKSYTRNLIVENDAYSLILLCWNPKKFSPIHSHGGANCFVRIIEGTLTEHFYCKKKVDCTNDTCCTTTSPCKVTECKKDDVTYIDGKNKIKIKR